jgi:hypothetical protein
MATTFFNFWVPVPGTCNGTQWLGSVPVPVSAWHITLLFVYPVHVWYRYWTSPYCNLSNTCNYLIELDPEPDSLPYFCERSRESRFEPVAVSVPDRCFFTHWIRGSGMIVRYWIRNIVFEAVLRIRDDFTPGSGWISFRIPDPGSYCKKKNLLLPKNCIVNFKILP